MAGHVIQRIYSGNRKSGDTVGKKEIKKIYQKPPLFSLKDLGEIMTIIILFPLACILSPKLWKIFLWPLAEVYYFTARGTKKNASDIKKIGDIYFESTNPEKIELAWVNNSFEQRALYFRECRPGGWNPEINVRGTELIDKALSSGKGVILWVAPFFFNNLIVKKGLYQAGYRIIHLSSFSHGPSVSKLGIRYFNPLFIRQENKFLEERIVIQPASRSGSIKTGPDFTHIRKLEKRLRENFLVTIGSEPGFGQKTIFAPFLKGKMPLATGAPALSLGTGSALIPVVTLRKGPLNFEVIIENPLEIPTEGNRHDKVNILLNNFSQTVETYVLKHPESFRFWHKIIVE